MVADLTTAGLSIATSESLTGGLLSARLTDVPGASRVVRGGLVVYASTTKGTVGGVPPDLLRSHGPVSAEVARSLAESVREDFGASFGVAVTGVAGPDPQPEQPLVPVGTVFVAVAGPVGTDVRLLRLTGDRGSVRERAVSEALRLVSEAIGAATEAPRVGPDAQGAGSGARSEVEARSAARTTATESGG